MNATPGDPLAGLTPEERSRLLGTVPLAVGFIAQADGKISFFEKFAAYRALIDLPKALGLGAAELAGTMDPVATQKRLQDKLRHAVEEELAASALLLERLPQATRERFITYFREACLRVAAASGGITDEEKRVLRRVFTVLGIPIPPEVMEKLIIRE